MASGKKRKPGELSDGEERCVQQYLINGGNQSKAYRAAFPHSKKWKADAVWRRASDLFKKPEVQARVRRLQEVATAQAVVTDMQLLREAANIALVDIRDLMDADGAMLMPSEWPAAAAAAVASVQYAHLPTYDKDGYVSGHVQVVKKVTMHNKLNAMEKLFRHMGLYRADNEQKANFEETGFAALNKEVRQIVRERLLELVAGAGNTVRPVLDGQAEPIGGSTPTQ